MAAPCFSTLEKEGHGDVGYGRGSFWVWKEESVREKAEQMLEGVALKPCWDSLKCLSSDISQLGTENILIRICRQDAVVL